MAEQTLLTEAEVENALREADRFAKVFRAFASLGDVAQRHIRMRREISRMEGDKAATVAATAKAKEAQAKAESEHVAKVAKLEAEFKQKRSEIEREHGEQITGLKSAIAKASARSETAEKSAKDLGIPFFFDPRLREHYFGLWHGVPLAKLQREEPRKLECLWQPDPEFAPPHGESLRQLQERMLAAFQDAVRAHRGQTILMVSHSEALGALMCGLLGISAANIRHLHLDPCSLSVVELREDVPVLTLWNDVHHLKGLSDG